MATSVDVSGAEWPFVAARTCVKRGIDNLAAADLGRITRAVKRKLKMLQYRLEVTDGCLAGVGMAH
ncbi:hypothetical protein AADR41_35625 [Streptomyces sp. CLV115]|uniref:hypothetical protein n=1 Tax=Streptomyces sp. CLV115 TaxID=3138502 RepID=UPI00313D0916